MVFQRFRKTELCRFFSEKRCYKGRSCQFAHGEDELRSPPDLSKTSMCRDWRQNKCKLPSDQCPFAHGRAELRFLKACKTASTEDEQTQSVLLECEKGGASEWDYRGNEYEEDFECGSLQNVAAAVIHETTNVREMVSKTGDIAGNTASYKDDFMPRDWMCLSCNAHNFTSRDECFLCGSPKEAGTIACNKPSQGSAQSAWNPESPLKPGMVSPPLSLDVQYVLASVGAVQVARQADMTSAFQKWVDFVMSLKQEDLSSLLLESTPQQYED